MCFIEIWNVDMFPKWGWGYAKRLNNRVVRNCLNMVLQNKPLEHRDFPCTSGLLMTQPIAAGAYCLLGLEISSFFTAYWIATHRYGML